MTETPLASKLRARIAHDGPISVGAYVAACLHDPEHGYYRHRPAIGAGGDFVTAPEISQTFGELIGLWAAAVWQQMGSPAALNLVELGPGRGTLMADALRALRIVPAFRDALRVHLVESNAALVPLQRAALAAHEVPLAWHAEVGPCTRALEDALRPLVVIANEFLDACPAEQYVLHDGRLVARGVGLGADGRLAFTLLAQEAPASVPIPPQLREGDVIEVQDFGFLAELAPLLAERPAAALFIDYGAATSGTGDTLQALRGHRSASPLEAPGAADLSFQVDFARFRDALLATPGLAVDGPVPQAEFLGRLGIVERASRLMAANPAKAAALEAGVQRLIAPSGMGSRFLVLGVRTGGLAPLPGLAPGGG